MIAAPGARFPRVLLASAQETIRRRTGLVFGDARRPTLEAALDKAMLAARTHDPRIFLARLGTEQRLLDELIGDITIGETYFFREPQQFAVMREEILPALVSRPLHGRQLRLWSAGCASGEETYSLAIVLREMGLAETTDLVGTDISRAALAVAGRARYRRWSFRGVAKEVTDTYFAREGDWFALDPRIRQRVEFRYVNLADDDPASPAAARTRGVDLILCRNVLIYFDDETVRRVACRLIDSLTDDGWLLVGASDPPLGDLAPCEAVITKAGLAYRKKHTGTAPGFGRTWPDWGEVAAADVAQAEQEKPPANPFYIIEGDERLPAASRGSRRSAGHDTEVAGDGAEPPTGDAAHTSDDAERAMRCYARREYPRAAELASRRLLVDPGDPALWVVLVRATANRGEMEAAGRWCVAALEFHRTSAELTYLHALLLGEGNCHAEAAQAARRALYLDPAFVVAHLALGSELTRLGDASGARRAFKNANRLLAALPPDAITPGADGVSVARLAEMARAQLSFAREVGV